MGVRAPICKQYGTASPHVLTPLLSLVTLFQQSKMTLVLELEIDAEWKKVALTYGAIMIVVKLKLCEIAIVMRSD